MKTRLTSVMYLGYTAMDKRFSNAMLPWLLKEIRSTRTCEKLSLTIEDGCLKAYNGNFEPVIVHRLVDIIRASQVPGRPDELFYILIDEKQSLFNCFLFRASTDAEVAELFTQMREPSPGAASTKGSTGSLTNGSVMKNIGFQQQNSTEHLPWSSPAISLPGNCSSNLTNESSLVRSISNASALTSLSADLSPSDSHFFEVLYIGKVRISQRKVPESLIDDALHKFSQHEVDKARNARRHSLLSSAGTSIYSKNSNESIDDKQTNSQEIKKSNIAIATTPLEPDKNLPWKSVEHLPNVDKDFDAFTKERIEKTNSCIVNKPIPEPLQPVLILNVPKKNLGTVKEDEEKYEEIPTDASVKISKSGDKVEIPREDSPPFDKKCIGLKKSVLPDNGPFMRDRSASIGTLNVKTPIAQLIGEQNRTMLFQIGRSELRLISPDRKQILLHRAFKDVASCVLGRLNKEHFGFVCRENTECYACYVFKCESDCIAQEVVNAIRQAFVAHAELLKKSHEQSPNMTCEHCPMLWYHRLCHDIEGMNDKKTHAFILRRVEQLTEDEQEIIITKYQGGTNHMYETSDHNSFLMMLLRAHCEAKQLRHVHDTAENRSEFLNQYLGGSTIFMKAKRSLSSGFDHLLKRKASRDDGNVVLHIKKEASPVPNLILDTCSEPSGSELLSPDINRCKSLSPAVVGSDSTPPSPKTSVPPALEDDDEEPSTPVNSPMMDIFLKVSDTRASQSPAGVEPDATWRQVIYEKVRHTDGQIMDGEPTQTDAPKGKRTKEQLRQLWKMAIEQTVLLVRMEKENTKLRESEESSFVRRIKLDYIEVGTCDAGIVLMWDSLLTNYNTHMAKVDKHMLMQAVIQGVPRMSRGAVWYFLAEQAALRSPPPDVRSFPNYAVAYRTLLSTLTKHHHAILIDLGRTFPKHSYFASALGPGQLALYNILKAYSLLDPEVGYCQGLSFIAGVLLLHMEEGEAFVLLRHLMFRRGLRKQYLPDMSGLQVQLYQFSRLLRDHEPELHAKLEQLDISPALYVAPWMLTLFTSQFPLGFVVRVFDLIFLESLDVVFAVSLALLMIHKDGVMLCESCEEAAEYLKHKLPDMSSVTYEKLMRKVQTLDIARQLSEYAVEYAVLREEMPRMTTLTEENRRLVRDADRMCSEMDSAMDAINSYQKNQARLEAQNKTMEQQLTLLSRYISAQRQDMPAEIKKIVQQHSKKNTFSSKIFNKSQQDDDPKKNLKTGISAPNLFSKITREDVLNAVNRTKTSPEKDKRFMMKKSQSVHSGLIKNSLKVLEENEPNSRTESFRNDASLKESLRELGRKNSGFFANTHEQIRMERLFEQQLKHDFDENLKKSAETTKSDDVNAFQSRKSMSLNLNAHDSKSDSGFVTPLSPDRKDSIVSHPLSDCDVDIKFDGQLTKLKQIRPVRSSVVDSKHA